MKKKICKVLALTLATVMLFTLAGCSRKVDPKKESLNALKGTMEAFNEVNEQFGYNELKKISVSDTLHQEMTLYLKELNADTDVSDFYGSGISMAADSDIAGNKMDIDFGLRIADYDALTAQIAFLDDNLYFVCEELLGEQAFHVNMKDLAAEEEGSFSASDWMETLQNHIDEDGNFLFSVDTVKKFKEAWETLSDASTWETAEKAMVVAGNDSAETDVYTLTIPVETFTAFLTSACDIVIHDDIFQFLMESAEITMDGYEVSFEDALNELETEMLETLSQPILVKFFVKDKLLRQVTAAVTDAAEDTLTASLTFGVGKQVADYMQLTIDLNDSTVAEWKSEGNHILTDDTYNDHTTFSINDPSGEGIISAEVETTYDTNSGAYDFTVDFDIEGETMSLGSNGTLVIEKDKMNMEIDDFYFDYMGGALGISFNGSYSLCKGDDFSSEVSDSTNIMELSEAETAALVESVATNLSYWFIDVAEHVPALEDLLFGSAY